MEYDFTNKDEMLTKFRAFRDNPDDDNILIKNKIYNILYHSPEILFLLNNKELEPELFKEDGSLNVDSDGEPLGAWDEYFGETGNIRPYLFMPDVQTDARNFICYATYFDDPLKYNYNNTNRAEKKIIVTFSVLCYATDTIDKYTGLPRHDLIACLLREKFAWSGFTASSAIPVQDKESVTDNNYLVRTIVFSAYVPNSLVKTNANGVTGFINKGRS